ARRDNVWGPARSVFTAISPRSPSSPRRSVARHSPARCGRRRRRQAGAGEQAQRQDQPAGGAHVRAAGGGAACGRGAAGGDGGRGAWLSPGGRLRRLRGELLSARASSSYGSVATPAAAFALVSV